MHVRVQSNFTLASTAVSFSKYFGGSFTTGIPTCIKVLRNIETGHKKWQRPLSIYFSMLVKARTATLMLFSKVLCTFLLRNNYRSLQTMRNL